MLSRLRSLSHLNRIRLVLGAVAVALLAYLLFAGKPWSVPMPWEKLKVSQYVTVFFWFAAAINLVLTGFLALTVRWWARPLTELGPGDLPPKPGARWFWPLVLVAMAITAVSSWPRLGHSFWHDEAYPVRRMIVGDYKEKNGEFKLDGAKWEETFFYYKKPNHVFHSVICRVFNDTWRFFARPTGLQFSETAIRLPTFFAGLAGIAAIALLLRQLGFASAGVIAAFLYALHPWHMRYVSDARAYSFVLWLVPLLFFFFLKAIQGGQWKWWLAYAVTQFALIYFYLTCVWILVVLNLCAPLAIWWLHGRSATAVTIGQRWLVANILAGMVFLQLMLPIVPQLLEYLQQTGGFGEVDYRWTQNFLAHLLTGIPWSYTLRYDSTYAELYPWAINHPGLFVLGAFLGIGFLILGIRRLIDSGRVAGLLIVPFLLPAIFCYIDFRAKSAHMYEWYIIFILPGVVVLAALGLDEFLTMGRSRPGRIAGLTFVAVVLTSYAAWTMPARRELMAHSIQPNRESVLLTRPSLDPHDPRQEEIITATFFGEPFPYDPRMEFFRTQPEFIELMHRADAENKALFINLGYLVSVEGEHPNKYALLTNSPLFEDLGLLKGFELLLSRHVFRYIPGSAADFDFTAIPLDPGSPGQAKD